MKHNGHQGDAAKEVAPPVGAWIETTLHAPMSKSVIVAPPVGAWIET